MRDDRDPFDDIFDEIERMMNEMADGMGPGAGADDAGFGTDAHVSLYEGDDTLRVVADLPGVEKDDIQLKCDGETLTISAATNHREYEERISLPVPVDEHSAQANYNNGVLEVTFDRESGSANIDLE